jgi:hypothetical protein
VRITISDSPGEDQARSVMDRLARSIAAVKDWSKGFPQSDAELRRELAGLDVTGIDAITVTELPELAMGSTGEIRIAAIESGQALVMNGRFSGDSEVAEAIGKLLGEDVRAGEFLVARSLDVMGTIEEEGSARVRNALLGLSARKD